MFHFKTMPAKQPSILNKFNGDHQAWTTIKYQGKISHFRTVIYMEDNSAFTMTKLEYVLDKIKANKSAGADHVPGELHEWLDVPNN